MLKRIRQAMTPPPPPATKPGPRWQAAEFVARIEAMIDDREGEQALDYFLSEVGNLAQSNLHRRTKLNHLRFLGRMLEGSTASKHGPDKLFRKTRMIGKSMEKLGVTAQGTFLDFGCGRHDPLGPATVAYANGFDRAIACDLDPVEIPAYSAQSMYEIMLEINRFPQRFLLPGGVRKDVHERVKALATRPFAKREFEEGIELLAGKVDYHLAELTTLNIEDEELGLAVSFAVLEHVTDAAAIYGWLFRKARPGSGQIHFIDLADHRAYGNRGDYNAWSFLTEDAVLPNMNRLRAHEHIELIRQAGFEIVSEERDTREMPPETRERLLAPWRDLPREELETTGLRLLLRRPE